MEEHSANHIFIFQNLDLENLTENTIARHTSNAVYFDSRACSHISPGIIELNQGTFTNDSDHINFPEVSIVQQENELALFCGCGSERGKLCEHQAQVLTAILRREELEVFFNKSLRHHKLRKFAADYGLENEKDPDHFFRIELLNKKLLITPRLPALIPVNKDSIEALNKLLADDPAPEQKPYPDLDETICVVLKQHKHYKYLVIELYKAQTSKDGKLKNPLNLVSPLDLIWETEDPQHLKFYTGIHKFQGLSTDKRSQSDLAALRAIVKNPLEYDFYCHDSSKSENVTASSVFPVKISRLSSEIVLNVKRESSFFELSGNIQIEGTLYDLKDLDLKFTYFLQTGNVMFLVDQVQALALVDFLKKKQDKLLVHESRYTEFRKALLGKLEDKIEINYSYVKPASKAQLKTNGFNETEKLIYLSDFGPHIMIIPVVRYGDTEIPIRTKRLIYAADAKGNEFIVKRNDPMEVSFTAMLVRQHAYFEEQMENDLQYFYLHKKHFLDEEWFLDTFEDWRQNDIAILGFNQIEGNKFNPEKAKIDIKVLSGLNWFNTIIDVRFGRKKVSLKHLHKAIRNKSKYVKLDDGTLGILPLEWIEKFSAYFNSGEIADAQTLLTPKINFSAVEALYDQDMLDAEVKDQLKIYRERFTGFDSIREIPVPEELNATLRPYQKQGLNWLNFLDDFDFGGCLADDMGLGKSIQVIAFILSQQKKVSHNTNLIVVPATLIFNWQSEIRKFAPSIRIHTLHGTERIKNTRGFDQFEVVLTSYGTLLSDVVFLKEYTFNYIFLDESQNIRNPETERYKAVRLLKSRNKIAITGTPVENNTFDLYSQFSFACPGLLGSKQYFRDVYSIPVDTFKSSKRALELRNKIKPFMLRRTKQQVASDLPEKTEMVLYCEMGLEQRQKYNASEKEFREYVSAATDDQLNKNSMNVLKGLTKLRQICDAPVLADELSGEIPSAKIDMLTEQIENKAPEHKILVFSQFVSMLDLISKELQAKKIRFVTLTGKTRNREAVVNEFQNNSETRVFLISLKAGGTGLNLTEADYVYLVDPWWNPAVENQAIDRAHRIGQDKHVIAVRLICPDTVEEKIMQMQETKKELAGELISADSSFLKSLSKENLLNILSKL